MRTSPSNTLIRMLTTSITGTTIHPRTQPVSPTPTGTGTSPSSTPTLTFQTSTTGTRTDFGPCGRCALHGGAALNRYRRSSHRLLKRGDISFTDRRSVMAPLQSEPTSFTLDNMGRFLCNTLQEALGSLAQTVGGRRRDFDVIVIGGGTF